MPNTICCTIRMWRPRVSMRSRTSTSMAGTRAAIRTHTSIRRATSRTTRTSRPPASTRCNTTSSSAGRKAAIHRLRSTRSAIWRPTRTSRPRTSIRSITSSTTASMRAAWPSTMACGIEATTAAPRNPPLSHSVSPALIDASRLRAQVRRRTAKAAAEGAVEVGQIAEPDLQGDCGDGLIGAARVGQQAMRAGEALLENEFGERGARLLEQSLDVTGSDSVPRGDETNGPFFIAEIVQDAVLDALEARRTDAAALGDCARVACRAERKAEQVENMRDGQ